MRNLTVIKTNEIRNTKQIYNILLNGVYFYELSEGCFISTQDLYFAVNCCKYVISYDEAINIFNKIN